MRINQASTFFPLIGKELEILAKREAGKSEYRLAIEYNVYPNAIRAAVKRALKMREEGQLEAVGK